MSQPCRLLLIYKLVFSIFVNPMSVINWTCALSNYVYIDSNRQVTPDLAPNYGDLDHDWHLSTLTPKPQEL